MRKSSPNQLSQATDLQQRADIRVNLTVYPPGSALMKARHIDLLVLTHLSYAGEALQDAHGNRVGFIEYAVDKQQEKQTFQASTSGSATEQSIHCGYVVVYADGKPAFHAPPISHQGQHLDLSRIDLGVLHVSLNGDGLPWDVLHSASVDLSYGDWETRVALQRGKAPLVLSKVFGQAMTANMTYRLMLDCMSGTVMSGDVLHVPLEHGRADITLTSPLGSGTAAITYTLDNDVNQAQLRVEYRFHGAHGEQLFHTLIELDRAKQTSSATWQVPVNEGKPGTLRLVKARIDGNDAQNLHTATIDAVETATTIAVCQDRFEVL